MVTATTLGIGRKNLKKVYFVEADKIEPQYKWIVGRTENTTQTSEKYKQLKGISMAVQTPDGTGVDFENPVPLYTKEAEPVLFTKGMKFSKMAKFTDQYAILVKRMPMFAQSFMHKKNQVVANLDNLGFTYTTYGVNSETLYETTHDMGGVTFANMNAVAAPLSPAAIKAALVSIRKQKSATNEPMPYTGTVILKVPVALEPEAIEYVKSLLIADSAENNTNEWLRRRIELKVCDYYTSDTAYFFRASDNSRHGLCLLEQMPFDIEALPINEEAMYPWIATESYEAFWYDAHGTWGDPGA